MDDVHRCLEIGKEKGREMQNVLFEAFQDHKDHTRSVMEEARKAFHAEKLQTESRWAAIVQRKAFENQREMTELKTQHKANVASLQKRFDSTFLQKLQTLEQLHEAAIEKAFDEKNNSLESCKSQLEQWMTEKEAEFVRSFKQTQEQLKQNLEMQNRQRTIEKE